MIKVKNKSILLSKDEFNKNLEISINYTVLESTYPIHCHDFYEIEIITEGEGTQLLNGNTYFLKRGDAYIIKPTDFHSISTNHTLKLYNIKFDEALLSDTVFLKHIDLTSDYFAHIDNEHFDMILSIIKSLEYEISHQKEYSTAMKHNLLEHLAISILRNCKKENTVSQDLKLKEILYFINQNYKSRLSLEDVSKHVGYTPSYFSNWFHNTIGKTYTEYINNLRLAEAKRLLLSTSKSATEIGFAVGFSSFSGFLKEFKKKYGITPSNLRKDLVGKA